MVIDNISRTINQRETNNDFSSDSRRSVSSVESRIGSDGGHLTDHLKEGGVLVDFGCGDGEVGKLLAKKHNMVLIQADMIDRRTNRRDPLILVDHYKAPDFGNSLNNTADVILLRNVLNAVMYGENSPAVSEVDLLRRLSSLLTDSGKIAVVADSSAATGEGALAVLQDVREAVLNDDQLKDRVIFYTPNEKRRAFHLIVDD